MNYLLPGALDKQVLERLSGRLSGFGEQIQYSDKDQAVMPRSAEAHKVRALFQPEHISGERPGEIRHEEKIDRCLCKERGGCHQRGIQNNQGGRCQNGPLAGLEISKQPGGQPQVMGLVQTFFLILPIAHSPKPERSKQCPVLPCALYQTIFIDRYYYTFTALAISPRPDPLPTAGLRTFPNRVRAAPASSHAFPVRRSCLREAL